jgi:hypothetical protein
LILGLKNGRHVWQDWDISSELHGLIVQLILQISQIGISGDAFQPQGN